MAISAAKFTNKNAPLEGVFCARCLCSGREAFSSQALRHDIKIAGPSELLQFVQCFKSPTILQEWRGARCRSCREASANFSARFERRTWNKVPRATF